MAAWKDQHLSLIPKKPAERYSVLVHTVSFKEVNNYRNAFLRFCFKHVDLDIRISIMDLEQC